VSGITLPAAKNLAFDQDYQGSFACQTLAPPYIAPTTVSAASSRRGATTTLSLTIAVQPNGGSGHTVKVMPPAYVKPYAKRQKNDATDAEAICEAVTRANMRFVPTKTPEQQGGLVLHRARHLFMRPANLGD